VFCLVELEGLEAGTPDPLLAKSAQRVPHRPWPGPTGFDGLLKSAEIQARWCQLWVSPRSPFVPNCRHGRVADRLDQLSWQMAAAKDGVYACPLLYFGAVPGGRP
jgi:hypothetical protein